MEQCGVDQIEQHPRSSELFALPPPGIDQAELGVR
jgi:hypothetical protein